jgi:hypothetical protein
VSEASGRRAVRWAGSRGPDRASVRAGVAGGGADDPDVQVLGEHQDAGAGVGAADADVVKFVGIRCTLKIWQRIRLTLVTL